MDWNLVQKLVEEGDQDRLFELAREHYFESGESLREVAVKFALPIGRLRAASAKGKWNARRSLFDEGEREPLSDVVERLCARLGEKIGSYFDDEDQFNRYLIKEGRDSETTEQVFGKADVKSIKEMAQALKALSECVSGLSEKRGASIEEATPGEAQSPSLKSVTVAFVGDVEKYCC